MPSCYFLPGYCKKEFPSLGKRDCLFYFSGKYRFWKSFLPLAITAITAVNSRAQHALTYDTSNEYYAVHWGVEDGLSQYFAGTMLKDVNGFLWIGTGFGLNRFDGSTFKNYFAGEDQRKKTVIGNNINGLIEDSLHNIWIGTDRGLSRYDINADTFSHFPSQWTVPFWATKTEVFIWNKADSQFEAYSIHSFVKRTLAKTNSSDTIGLLLAESFTIFDTESNSLWVEEGTPGWFGGKGGGLLQISLSNGKRRLFEWNCFRHIPNHSHFTQGMRYDRSRKSIWISSGDGLLEFTLSDKVFHMADAFRPLAMMSDYWESSGIDLDQRGRVWVGTYPKGIYVYDPRSGAIKPAFPDDSSLQHITSGGNASIYCDRDGIIWTGYFSTKGIYGLIPYSKSVVRYETKKQGPQGLQFDQFMNCVNSGEGTLWLGTTQGLTVFDPISGLFNVLREKDLPGFKGKVIIPMYVDSTKRKAWLFNGPLGNIFEFDLRKNECHPVIFQNRYGQPVSNVSEIHPKTGLYNNRCIVPAKYNNHQIIFIQKPDSAIAEEALDFPDGTVDLFKIMVGERYLFLKSNVSKFNLTYAHENGKWVRINSPLDSLAWSRILYYEIDHSYWVAVDRMLIHISRDFKVIRQYSQVDGLPLMPIFSMIADNNGDIWWNTDRSISMLKVKSGKIISLSERDGYHKQDFTEISTRAKDRFGHLYFPSGNVFGNGFDQIFPEILAKNFPPSKVYIKSLMINQRPIDLAMGVNDLKELLLTYSENKISIETGIIDYFNNGQCQIRYKLDEGNNDWQYAPANYTIRYDELPPGNYQLLIQGSNALNDFNGSVKTLHIDIKSAFWKTWWFKTIAILVLYVSIRWQIKQKYQLQLERSHRQAAELLQQKTDLEMQALRAQMNPHFIFNSLNSINRFILQNNKAQASEYLTKFSKLVRMILQNSQASLISLESELECLELYLELEALRFDHRFNYKIYVPGDMDLEMLRVPPLIIQPYAENAIWHGLMHKEEKGQLDIQLEQQGHTLFITVRDNGVGRKQTAVLDNKSAIRHKSMGLKLTAERIAMMKSNGGSESPVTIRDLVNADGTPAGTEVVLAIPVQMQS
ncbi:MAG: hypothetical protein C5B59_06175 [Bacteroidetes bacterium]|nr:MAG: hypothetical protein C5B59_06175 [Bacteroidota bacterium]